MVMVIGMKNTDTPIKISSWCPLVNVEQQIDDLRQQIEQLKLENAWLHKIKEVYESHVPFLHAHGIQDKPIPKPWEKKDGRMKY